MAEKIVPPTVERGFFASTRPLAAWVIRAGVSPNTLTTIGALVVVGSGVAYGFGAIRSGGLLLLLSGVVDTLDGQVARATGRTSAFGAFYDSTLDRVGDGATFIGIAAWFLTDPSVRYPVLGAMVCMVAVLAAMVVSYARARAEGLGLDCKVGLVQRAERIILIGGSTLIIGAGPGALILLALVGLLMLGSVITVVQRFVYVYRVAGPAASGTKAAPPVR